MIVTVDSGEWERSAEFEVRPGTMDETVLAEVWSENTYAMLPDYVLDQTVVDVGANIGAFTLWALAHGARMVHAVEPDPGNLAALLANVQRNGWSDRLCPHAAAVVAQAGPVAMIPDPSGLRVDPGGEFRGFVGVTLASIIKHATPGYSVSRRGAAAPVAVLKVDIEGGEWDALKGSAWLRGVQRLTMETHGPRFGTVDPGPGKQFRPWGQLLTMLAEHGQVEVIGRPSVGGMLHWVRYP